MRNLCFFIFLSLLNGAVLQNLDCNANLDVVVVADASTSVGGSFNLIQQTVRDFINEVTTSNPNIRIGVVFYNNIAVSTPLSNNAAVLTNFVNTQSGGTGTTLTHVGIERAINILDTRNPAQLYPGNIIVITDAISAQPTQTAFQANLAATKGYQVFAVGVNVGATSGYMQELNDIARDPARVFDIGFLAQVSATVTELGRSLCAYTVCSGCVVDFGTRRVAHPTRCDKFYMCEQREGEAMIAHEKSCPIGQIWHRRFSTCVPSDVGLSDPNARCNYCQGTVTQYPVADSCELYYQCERNAQGNQYLDVRCCPENFAYDAATSTCQSSTTCAHRRYKDPASCSSYYTCSAATTGNYEWSRPCCSTGGLNYYNHTLQQCQSDSNCRGACNDANYRDCGYLSPLPDVCKFRVTISTFTFNMDCPALTRYDDTQCICVRDDIACPAATTIPTTCDPSVLIPVDSTVQTWGFQESSTKNPRWIECNGINIAENIVNNAVRMTGDTSLVVPYYNSNDQAFLKSDVIFFRLSVLEDGSATSEMSVLDNTPCSGSANSEAGTEASVQITLNPASTRVAQSVITFTIRTTEGSQTLELFYNTAVRAGNWKEITLRYDMANARMEAGLRFYNIISGNRNFLPGDVQDSAALTGRILTSSCGLVIGNGARSTSNGFRGDIDSILFYDDCGATPVMNLLDSSPESLYN